MKPGAVLAYLANLDALGIREGLAVKYLQADLLAIAERRLWDVSDCGCVHLLAAA